MTELTLTSLLYYTLAAFGLAYIAGHSRISLPFRLLLEPPRDARYRGTGGRALHALRNYLLALVECPACLGFWIGLCYGWFELGQSLFDSVKLGLYTTGTNFLLARAGGLIGGILIQEGEVK